MNEQDEINNIELPKSSFDKLFTPFKDDIDFLDIDLGFKIDPDHFVEWLKMENDDDDYIDGDYSHNVNNACEYACLYLAMILIGKKLDSEPIIHCGNFGFWEHYWLEYSYKGQRYFIDLTLKQFVKDAPKLAISIPENLDNGYNWYEDIEGEPISEYIKRKRAFEFYINPNLNKSEWKKKQFPGLTSRFAS